MNDINMDVSFSVDLPFPNGLAYYILPDTKEPCFETTGVSESG
jgi:hypothetical protein